MCSQSLSIFFSLLYFVLHRITELHSFHLNSNTSENRQDRQASCGPRRKDAFDKRSCETKSCLCLVMCLLNTNTVIALVQSSKELCRVLVALKTLEWTLTASAKSALLKQGKSLC